MTDRLISLQAAVNAIVNTPSKVGYHDNSEVARYGATFRQHEILDIIERLPEAVTRCKDCKHYKSVLAHCTIRGDKAFLIRGPNDYCSRAEMREKDGEG